MHSIYRYLTWPGFFLVVIVLITACAQPSPSATPVPKTATPSLAAQISYSTPTPTQTPQPHPTIRAAAPFTPAPTATPFVHIIKKGDTLGGIAFLYGVSLEDLLLSNPGIDPGFLSVDATVIVPVAGADVAVIATSTPVPLDHDLPRCYPETGGGLWCFLLLQNERETALENLSGWIGLYDASGQNQAAQEATAPLNILPAGRSMPLMAYFPPPLQTGLTPGAELLAALAVAEGDGRYIMAEVVMDRLEIREDQRTAALSGQVLLPATGPAARVVWLAAVAYGAEGEVVGVRKWESSENPCENWVVHETPQPASMAACLSFDFTVSSLGSGIERVEILVEARP